MVEMFELFAGVIEVAQEETNLDVAKDRVLKEIDLELGGHVSIFKSSFFDIRQQYLDIQENYGQETERWLMSNTKSLQILIGTEFLAYAYVIKNHDWKGGTLPVLCTSTTELKNSSPAIILEDWLDEQCWKEVNKTS